MKKFLIFLIFCLPLLGEAQTQKERVDKLVSRERVSTGILYNRVMPWAGLHIFSQNGRKDTSSLKHFKQSIYEMEVASNQKGDATYSFILNNWMYHQNKQNIMPIGVLNHVFEYSPDLAIEKLSNFLYFS